MSVILICIQNPEFINVTVSHVFNHFIGKGPIEKILIFERNKPVWKALVQFTLKESAEEALTLSNTLMHGLSILVFQSKRKSLDFQARNQYARCYIGEGQQAQSHSLMLPRENEPQFQLQQQVQSMMITHSHVTDFQINQIANCASSDYGSDDEQILKEESVKKVPEELSDRFKSMIDDNLQNLLAMTTNQTRTFQSQQLPQTTNFDNNLIQSEMLQQKKLLTKVVYANWFDPKMTTLPMIYNVFSTFGNITKMIYFKTKSNALIEYTTEVSVKFLLSNFNDASPTLFGQKLKVYPSNYEFIFFRNCTEGDIPQNTDEEEYYKGNENTFRYKSNNFKYLVPPTNQIMLTNLKKEFCEDGVILEYFGKFGRIEKLKILCEEKNKNKCLIRYSDMESAMQALAIMHNYEYNKRKIQIFFSKKILQ